MKSKLNFYLFTGLVAVIGIFVTVETLQAEPEGPQRLRGMDDRVFEVEVQNITTGEPPFVNCYGFNADGSWDDPLFPVLGTWEQHSVGTSTTYSAEASVEFIPGVIYVELLQDGVVTPANGGGVLQLEATSIVTVYLITPDGLVPIDVVEFYSVGAQNNDCTLPEP